MVAVEAAMLGELMFDKIHTVAPVPLAYRVRRDGKERSR